MSISRFTMLGLVCLLASACTVVVQPAADQPEPSPRASDPEADAGVTDPEPVRRPPLKEPRRRSEDPDPDPGYYEPESPPTRPRGGSTASNLGIPPGHLPPVGECRVWVEGTPPGRQARARSCHGILATAPVGSWILYRPARYQRQLRVRYLHETQRLVVAVRAYDAETGAYLRDLALAEDDNNIGPLATGARRPTDRPVADPAGTRGNSGNAPGRTGTTNDRGVAAGNNGVAVGRADTTGNRRSDGRNNGLAVGRADTTKNTTPGQENRGNQGGENRPANAAGEPANQGRANSTRSADSTGVGRVGTGASGIPTGQPDTSSSRRTASGNSGISVGQTDSTSEGRTARGKTGVGVRRADVTRVGGAVTSGGGAATEEPRREDANGRADRRDEPEDTGLGSSEVQPTLGVDARYLPKEGQCRVWVPGQPFGRQPRPTSCDGIVDEAPAGAWILRRTTDQPDVIQVDYVDEEQAGVIVRTGAFDVATGAVLRSARLEPR
jgi:hypothetical protein